MLVMVRGWGRLFFFCVGAIGDGTNDGMGGPAGAIIKAGISTSCSNLNCELDEILYQMYVDFTVEQRTRYQK